MSIQNKYNVISLSHLLQSSAYHLESHSFPTRRSSDLHLYATGSNSCHSRFKPYCLRPILTQYDSRTCCRQRKCLTVRTEDRKSTRLNSSHVEISYAVFCLKKKNKK